MTIHSFISALRRRWREPHSAGYIFRSFQSDLKERCIERPRQTAAIIVGNYRMIGEG